MEVVRLPGFGVSLVMEILRIGDTFTAFIRLGHSEEETAADPSILVIPGDKVERLYQANIRFMFKKLIG